MSGLRLDFDLTEIPWVIGPTEARPFEVWLPQAVQLMSRTFELGRRDKRKVEYLTAVLSRVGADDERTLPYVIIRWLEIAELPMVAGFGMVDRDGAEAGDFLASADLPPVEPPVRSDVPAPPEVSVRRSLAYSDVDGGLFTAVRYVVDTGHPAAVGLVNAGSREPGAVVAALDELDAFAATMRILPDEG